MASDDVVEVPVAELTTRFMKCARCFEPDHVAEGLSPLWPPRGWAGPERIRMPVLLVVSMNPGHPMCLPTKHGTGWDEFAVLRRHGLLGAPQVDAGDLVVRRRLTVTSEAAREVAAFCWRAYDAPTAAGDHVFHRRSVAYARACLWLMGADPSRWREHCWFTDAVKCSTTRETNVGVPATAVSACRAHLVHEIDTLRPAVIAALGGDARRAADAAKETAQTKPLVVQFLHPARWRKLTSERQMSSFLASGLGEKERAPGSSAFRSHLERIQTELQRRP